MTKNTAKQYGPPTWSESVLKRVHTFETDNYASQAIEATTVEHWKENFKRRAAEFGQGVKFLVSQTDALDPRPEGNGK
jgi:hypothetical protein